MHDKRKSQLWQDTHHSLTAVPRFLLTKSDVIPCVAYTYKIAIIWRRCWRCWPVLPTRRDTLSRLHRRRSLMKLIKEITSMSRDFVLSQLFSLLHTNIMCRWNHLSPNKNLYEQINYGCVDPKQSACSVCLTLLLLKQGHLVETWAVKMLNDWEQ